MYVFLGLEVRNKYEKLLPHFQTEKNEHGHT
jgi:hypothetical protein